MHGETSERRLQDRRAKAIFRVPERRTGFDRRRVYPVLGHLRSSKWALPTLLVAINLLSLADWLFTMRALQIGATEGNPVIASMLASSPALAAAFKLSVTLAVTLGIWFWRRYRLVLATSLFGVGAYTAVIAYHLGGLAALGVL